MKPIKRDPSTLFLLSPLLCVHGSSARRPVPPPLLRFSHPKTLPRMSFDGPKLRHLPSCLIIAFAAASASSAIRHVHWWFVDHCKPSPSAGRGLLLLHSAGTRFSRSDPSFTRLCGWCSHGTLSTGAFAGFAEPPCSKWYWNFCYVQTLSSRHSLILSSPTSLAFVYVWPPSTADRQAWRPDRAHQV